MPDFIESAPEDGLCVLSLVGEVDIATADELVEAGRRCLDRADRVELDLSGLTFIDSSGLGALVRIRNEAAEQAKSMVLTHVSAAAARLLQITGLDQAFTIQPHQP
jgi:anti-anti-sigma factor